MVLAVILKINQEPAFQEILVLINLLFIVGLVISFIIRVARASIGFWG